MHEKKPLIIFILLLLVLSLTAQNKGGRWRFEQNGFDSAHWDTIEDPGVLQGNAGFATTNAAEGTAFLWLDILDTNDYIRIEDSDDLDFTDENIGISAWIYPTIINDVHYIINKGDQFSNPKTTNYSVRISNSGNLEFLIRDAGNAARRVTSNFVIAENQWTFVAVFYEYSAGEVYMWNNPAAAATDTLAFNQSFFANDDPLSIGSWYRSDPEDPSIKDFQGGIDDVRISGRIEDILDLTSALPESILPVEFRVMQNYPNPFNNATLIEFSLRESAHVVLEVFDTTGKIIAELLNNRVERGIHSVRFYGNDLATGIYYYRISTTQSSSIKKMTLIK